jgi:hypothetical protein
MISPEMAKPATVSSEPALNVEQLGGPLDLINTQTNALRKHLALGYYIAMTLAPLLYGVVPR